MACTPVAGNSTVFVDNLTVDISLDKLWKVFHVYGQISQIKIARKQRAHSQRRFAFIIFKLQGDALKAVKHAHGRTIDSLRIRVELAYPKRQRSASPPTFTWKAEEDPPHLRNKSGFVKGTHLPAASVPIRDPIKAEFSEDMNSNLKRSCVIEVRSPSCIKDIKQRFEKIVPVDRVSLLSCSKFLVTLCSSEDLETVMNTKPHWNLHLWTQEDHQTSRSALFVIRGIPLKAWSLNTISKLAQSVGDVFVIKHAVFPEALVQINTSQLTTVTRDELLDCEGEKFPIGISECVSLSILGFNQLLSDETSRTCSQSKSLVNSPLKNDHSPRDCSSQFVTPSSSRLVPQSNSQSFSDSEAKKAEGPFCPVEDESPNSLHLLGINRLLELLPDVCAFNGCSSLDKGTELFESKSTQPAGAAHIPSSPVVSVIADSEELDGSSAVGRRVPISIFGRPVETVERDDGTALFREGDYHDKATSVINTTNEVDEPLSPSHEEEGVAARCSLTAFDYAKNCYKAREEKEALATNEKTSAQAQLNSSPAQSMGPVQDVTQTQTSPGLFVTDPGVSQVNNCIITNDPFISMDNGQDNGIGSRTDQEDLKQIQIPSEIPDFMKKYYIIGSTLMGMDATKSALPEAVACLGFGKDLNFHIPNPKLVLEKFEETLGASRKSARIKDNSIRKRNRFSSAPYEVDSDSSSSAVF